MPGVANTNSFNTANANGVTTVFSFTFFCYDEDDVKVYTVENDVETPITTGITKAINSNFIGGSVTFSVAPTSGKKVLIRREMDYTQEKEFAELTRYKETAIETALNTIVLQLQQIANRSSRALKYADTATITDATVETPVDDAVLVFEGVTGRVKAGPLTTDIATVAEVIDDVVAVAAALSSIAAVESNATNINTLAGAISNVNAVGSNIADVTTVADNLNGTDTIGVVAAIDAQVQAIAAELTALVDIAANLDDIINSVNNGQVVLSLAAAAGNNFTIGETGYITSSGVVKTDATQESTARGVLVMATGTINAGSTGVFLLRGELEGLSGLTDQANYYLATSPGDWATSQPYTSGSVVRYIGTAIGTTSIFFSPSPTYIVVTANNTYPPVIVESSSQGYELNDGTLVLDAPADIETGDYLLLVVGADYTGAETATFTPPADFEELVAYTRVDAGSEGVAMQAWGKFAGSEPATYTITETALQKFGAVMLRISGVDPAYPIDVQAVGSGAATEPTVPAITTTVDEVVSIAAVTWDGSKTLTTGPSGFTALQHVDQSGLDIYVAQKNEVLAGAAASAAVDISSADDWVAFRFGFRKQGATSGGGGSDVGPFPLNDDGLGYTVKLTLPVNEAGELSAATDAHEIFCSNSPSYDAGDTQLENFVHPIYFLRTASAYRMASPIRPGAYTSSNTNGPARCEFRHERNYGPTERIRFKSTIQLIQAAANSKCTCVQIHRVDASPVIKGVIQVDSGGTTWKFRTLVKKSDGASDETLDKNGQDTNAATGLAFATPVTIEYDWTPGGDLKIWVNTANTNAPSRWYENVLASDVASYIKPGGPYPSNKGNGADSDLWIVDVIDFVLIDNDGNEIPR